MLKFRDLCDVTLYLFYVLAWRGPGRVRAGSIERVRPGPVSAALHLKAVNELIDRKLVQSIRGKDDRPENAEYGISRAGIDHVEAALADAQSSIMLFRREGAAIFVEHSPVRTHADSGQNSTATSGESAGTASPQAWPGSEPRTDDATDGADLIHLRPGFEQLYLKLADAGPDASGSRCLLRLALGLLHPDIDRLELLEVALGELGRHEALKQDTGPLLEQLRAARGAGPG